MTRIWLRKIRAIWIGLAAAAGLLFLTTSPAVAQELFLSDFESHGAALTGPVRIFDSEIRQRTRLYLYNSKHDAAIQRRVIVRLVNEGSTDATFRLSKGVGGPASSSSSAVAAKASGCFWLARWRNQTVSFTVPGSAWRDLANVVLDGSDATYNALFELEAAPVPGHVSVVVILAPVNAHASSTSGKELPLVPDEGPHQRSKVYDLSAFTPPPSAQLVLTDQSRSAGPDGAPQAALVLGKDDWGDYGVVLPLTFHVTNRSGSPRTVTLYFEPRGGSAQGTFVTRDGTMVQTNLLCGPDFDTTQCVGDRARRARYELPVRYTIPPGQSRDVIVNTFAEADSSFPAYLVLGENVPSQPASIRGANAAYSWSFNGRIGTLSADMCR